MEWDEFIKAINSAWDNNKKNSKLRFNGVYKIFEQIQPDKDNLLQALKASCSSELQVAQTLNIYVLMITIGFGILTLLLNYALSKNDNYSAIVYIILIGITLISLGIITIIMLGGAKKSRFIISVIEIYESDKKKLSDESNMHTAINNKNDFKSKKLRHRKKQD